MKRLLAVSAFALLAASASYAGSLTPPGAPASTMKTLSQLEPRIDVATLSGDATNVRIISSPGSYYLTADVTGVSAKNGIFISASNVTIDLNGFSVIGVAGALTGISGTGSVNSAVFNGVVRSWPVNGLQLGNDARVEGVTLTSNTQMGCETNIGAKVSHCTAAGNGTYGFVSNGASTFSGCVARSNGSDGFLTSAGDVYTGCTADFNTGNGFNGADVTHFSECVALQNTQNGFFLEVFASAVNCLASGNTLDGIKGNGSNLIRGNNCNINGNGGVGAGINVSGGAGRCRVEGNNCDQNDVGIDANPASTNPNFIVGNSVAGNGVTYDINAANISGTIVTTSAAMNAAANSLVNLAN